MAPNRTRAPGPARRAARAALVTSALCLVTACTGTNLDGGLSAADLGVTAPRGATPPTDIAGATGTERTESTFAAGADATTTLAAASADGAGTTDGAAATADAARVAALAAAATAPGAGTGEVVAAAVPTESAAAPAATAAPVPPLPIAGERDEAAPTVLAMAPVETKRPNALSLFRARTERAALSPAPPPRKVERRAREERHQERRQERHTERRTTRRRPAEAPATETASADAPRRSVTIIKPRRPVAAGAGLPGVRPRSSLFQIGRGSRRENEAARAFRVASAAGMARLSGNGFRKQTAHVKTECFVPRLVQTLRYVEKHYGKPVTVTSGYRSPKGNRRAGGAKGSKHMSCEAADFQVEGVSKWELAKFLRSLPGRGGVGTYCHTASVHYDVGSERDWNWGCRKKRRR